VSEEAREEHPEKWNDLQDKPPVVVRIEIRCQQTHTRCGVPANFPKSYGVPGSIIVGWLFDGVCVVVFQVVVFDFICEVLEQGVAPIRGIREEGPEMYHFMEEDATPGVHIMLHIVEAARRVVIAAPRLLVGLRLEV
jgi:hypothetical protein